MTEMRFRSLSRTTNNIGPTPEPWTIPLLIGLGAEICCVLPVRKELSQLRIGDGKLSCCSLVNKIP